VIIIKGKETEYLSKRVSQKKIFLFFSVCMLIIVCLPLLIIANYNFLSVDDYSFVNDSIDLWRDTHSIPKVLVSQFKVAVEMYKTWQGTFAISWLGGGLTVVIGEFHYYLVTYISLILFIVSEVILFRGIATKLLHADKIDSCIVMCWLIIIQILMVPYPVEAFFWACGAFAYILPYSFTLLLFSLIIQIVDHNDHMWIKAGIVLLSPLVAFGNFVTGLLYFSAYILIVALLWLRKSHGRIFLTIGFVYYSILFYLCVSAPGNSVRAGGELFKTGGIIKSVIKSILTAAEYLVTNLYPTVIIVLIMMVPFMLQMVKQKALAGKGAFKYPMIFSLLTFGLFSSQFVPSMYSLGILGAGRVVNIYRFTMYIFLFSNLIYWIGWFIRRLHDEHSEISLSMFDTKKSYLLLTEGVLLVIFCFASYFYGGKTLTTVSAVNSLRSGQAAEYRREYEIRLDKLNDPSAKDIVLDEFSDPPYLLFFGDIKEDSSAWENRTMADFYGKDSVTLSSGD